MCTLLEIALERNQLLLLVGAGKAGNIDRQGIFHWAAEKAMQGLSHRFRLQIPKCYIDCAEGINIETTKMPANAHGIVEHFADCYGRSGFLGKQDGGNQNLDNLLYDFGRNRRLGFSPAHHPIGRRELNNQSLDIARVNRSIGFCQGIAAAV